MAQQRRMIYAKMLGSHQINLCSVPERYLYVATLILADDDGRLNADPRYLRGQVFSYDDSITTEDVEEMLTTLHNKELIQLYTVKNTRYINHPNWKDYQKIRKDMYSESKIPGIKTQEAEPCTVPLQTCNETVTEPLPKLSQVKLNKTKVSKDTPAKADVSPSEGALINQVISFFEVVNPNIEKLYGMKAQREAAQLLLKKHGVEQVERMVEMLPEINRKRGMPTSTTPNQLVANMGRIKARLEQENDKGNKGKKIII